MKCKEFFVGVLFVSGQLLYGQASPKLRSVVLDFKPMGKSSMLTRVMMNMLSDEFGKKLEKTGGFRVFGKSQVEEWLKKKGKESLLVSRSLADLVEIGKISGADRVFVGEIGEEEFVYSVTVKMVDVKGRKTLVSYNERCEGSLYELMENTLKILAQRMADFSPEMVLEEKIKEGTGSLKVTSVPDGARVLLDGKPGGTTPLVLMNIRPSTYLLKLSAPTYADVLDSVVVEEGKVKTVSYELEGTGTLDISGEPMGADVFWEENPLGSIPFQVDLAQGEYWLDTGMEGYRKDRKRVTIVHGKTTPLKVNLKYLGRTRGKAFLRSTLFPGWGQLYAEKKIRGWLFVIGGTASIAGAAYTFNEYISKCSEYNDANDLYLKATAPEDYIKYKVMAHQNYTKRY
ncbi:PEGA domain-containing protein [candidate division KSB1 bacterium]|nr:PEGA domain-containing protein [candidate division KSB1 bacterium]